MDCRQASNWLALGAGQDLTEADIAASVEHHLHQCPLCRRKQSDLQSTLNLLAEAQLMPDPRRRLWPRVSQRLAELELRPRFLRFNVWVPTTLAAAACLLMVSVVAVEFQRHNERDLFGQPWQASSQRDLFQSDPQFNVGRGQLPTSADWKRWETAHDEQQRRPFRNPEVQSARYPADW